MPGPAFLRGERVSLHPIEAEDLEFVQRLGNEPRIRHGLTTAHPRNAHEIEQAHERHSEDDSSVGLLVCATDTETGDATDVVDTDAETGAELDDGPTPVGQIVLFDVDEVHGSGEMAASILPEYHGGGYATAATALTVEYALGERRLHKVVARAIEPNRASRRVLEKIGMTAEGRQRDEKYVRGRFHDVVRYSILADEWEGPEPWAGSPEDGASESPATTATGTGGDD